MAEQFTGDFHVVGTRDGSVAVTAEFDVILGAASTISAGQLVTVDGGNAGYALLAANGASTDETWIGIAVADSTETVAADGVVQVMYAPSGLIVRGAPHTPGNLAQAIIDTSVILSVAAGVQTIDENDVTKGVLTIVRYDTTLETIDVSVPFQL